MFQFLWRPRPPSQLSKEQEEDLVKNLKKYSKKYDEEDAQILHAVRFLPPQHSQQAQCAPRMFHRGQL